MKLEKITDRMVYEDNTITKRMLFNEEKILNFVLNLRPTQSLPPHIHETSDLIVHILVGEGEVTVDGNTTPITQGDVIHCHGTEVFGLKNTGEKDMSCFVVLAPNPSAIYAKEV